MPVTALLNQPVTIVRMASSDTTDDYGNAVATPTVIATVGELQQERRDEPAGQGEFSRTDWLLILPADAELDTSDRVFAAGRAYEVVGDPWRARNPRTGVVSHVEATLRSTGGADAVAADLSLEWGDDLWGVGLWA